MTTPLSGWLILGAVCETRMGYVSHAEEFHTEKRGFALWVRAPAMGNLPTDTLVCVSVCTHLCGSCVPTAALLASR